MDKFENKQIEENEIDFDEGSRMSFMENGDALPVKANDESRMSFLESSEADLPTNFFNTQLRSEDDEGKTTYQEVFDFNSDDSVQDPDFELSLSDETGNITDIEEDVGLNDAPTTSQRAYSRKISYERRNQGKTYVNVKGNVVSERKLRPLVHDCRLKCKGKVPRTLQESLFGKYWSLGTYNQRILFIESLIDIKNKKTQKMEKHPEKPRERKFQAYYHVEYEGQRVQVCQKCFLQCFDESASFVKTVLKNKLNFPQNNLSDQRGSGGGKNKLADDIIQLVKDHINSFPNYESHYSRRDTSCKYFHADLSLAQMYKLYCDKYKAEAISISSYASVFKGMNIKFKKPGLDTCSKCDQLTAKMGIAKQEGDSNLLRDLEIELSTHQNKADLAYESKRKDKASAANDSTVKVYSFDLQQCLPTPFLRNSISFYKRQLWTYNLTVHDCTTGTPHCFMWHEALSARGGNQIASCLFKHIVTNLKQINHAIFYSDSCAGQNKNSFVCAMFILALEINTDLETIDHKFLEPGHTHMECDVDHSVIERKKKRTNTQIHHPHDWYNFVRCVGSKHTFNVIEMNAEDFFNFSLLLKTKLMWRAINQDGERFVWKNIRWLRYTKSNFGKIEYKTTLDIDAPFQKINLLKRGINSMNKDDLSVLNGEVKISSKKKNDILDLLPFINIHFHPFYKSLLTEESLEIHPDLVEDEPETK